MCTNSYRLGLCCVVVLLCCGLCDSFPAGICSSEGNVFFSVKGK